MDLAAMAELQRYLPLDDATWASFVPGLIAVAVFVVVLFWSWRRLISGSVNRKRQFPRLAYEADITNPLRQMDYVKAVDFEVQPLLNKSEFQILLLLEAVVRDLDAGFRVMAQTSLGEVLRPKRTWRQSDADFAYRSINSKRADFIIVDRFGLTVVAVEYQGRGHYQGNAVLRDAVKREAFLKANVAFVEVPADFKKADVMRGVRSVLERHANGRPPLLPV